MASHRKWPPPDSVGTYLNPFEDQHGVIRQGAKAGTSAEEGIDLGGEPKDPGKAHRPRLHIRGWYGDADALPTYKAKVPPQVPAKGPDGRISNQHTMAWCQVRDDTFAAEPPEGFLGDFYRWYFFNVLPRIGGIISGHPSAYSYLPKSVARFFRPAELASLLRVVGYQSVEYDVWTLGAVALHVGHRPE